MTNAVKIMAMEEGTTTTKLAEIMATAEGATTTKAADIMAMDPREMATIKTDITTLAHTGPGMSPMNWSQELFLGRPSKPSSTI